MAVASLTLRPRPLAGLALSTSELRGRHLALDGVRAVAIGLVFLSHAISAGPIARVTQHFNVGVTLFFVLSGFLLFRPFAAAHFGSGRRPSLRRYCRRRCFRILPAYWLALAAIVLLPVPLASLPADVWRYPLLVQNISGATAFGVIPAAWSLCVEMSFYAFLPIFVLGLHLLTRRTTGNQRVGLTVALIVGLAVLSLTARTLLLASNGLTVVVWGSLPGTFDWFAAGMLLAVADVQGWQRDGGIGWVRALASRPALCWSLAVAIFALWVVLTGPPEMFDPLRPPSVGVLPQTAQHLAAGVIAMLFILPVALDAERRGWAHRALRAGPVVSLGLISYGVLLWHQKVLDLVSGLLAQSGQFAVALCAAVVVVVPAAGSYVLVERPLLRRAAAVT